MKEILINVYDDENNVLKTEKAETLDLRMGTVRALVKLLKIDELKTSYDLLKVVVGVWDQLTKILTQCFPGMTYEDWDGVKVREIVPVLIDLLKDVFAELKAIPKDPKNQVGD